MVKYLSVVPGSVVGNEIRFCFSGNKLVRVIGFVIDWYELTDWISGKSKSRSR